MTQQIPLGADAQAEQTDPHDGTHEIRPDIAYCRLTMVNVVLFGAPGAGDRNWVLVDAGVIGSRGFIERAGAARFGEGARPSAIVLTHGHFDHVGALEALATAWDVPVYAHPVEHPYLDGTAAYPPGDPSVGGGLMATLSGFYPTKPVDVSGRLRPLPEDGTVPGMPGWRWLHTPGHSPGHVSLWREADRTLIAGDAFVTTAPESAYATAVQAPEIHGPPRYFTVDWAASRASVERLAALDPALAVTGHGRPMKGAAMAAALKTLAREFAAVAVPKAGLYVDRPARAEDGSAYRNVSADTRERAGSEHLAPSPVEAWFSGAMSGHVLNLAVAAFTSYALATLIHRRPAPAALSRPKVAPQTSYRSPSPSRDERSSIRFR